MTITTESGAVYEYNEAERTVTRQSETDLMRGDGRPLKARFHGTPKVGVRMVLFLEPLAPDADVTIRTTTPIVSIDL